MSRKSSIHLQFLETSESIIHHFGLFPFGLLFLFTILADTLPYTPDIKPHHRQERSIEDQHCLPIIDQQGQCHQYNQQSIACHTKQGSQHTLTESKAHIVHLKCQPIASLFTDKKQTPTVIGREKRETQPLIQRKQITILKTGKAYNQDTLKQNNAHSQQTEIHGCPLVLTTFQ